MQRGLVLERGNPQDLMPTMAWLLGLPIADELVGKPLTEAFDPDFVEKRRSRQVVGYGPREVGTSVPSAADEEMLESLRSLGYITLDLPNTPITLCIPNTNVGVISIDLR